MQSLVVLPVGQEIKNLDAAGWLPGGPTVPSFRFFSRSERTTSEIFASAGMRTGWSSSSTLQEMLQPPCVT